MLKYMHIAIRRSVRSLKKKSPSQIYIILVGVIAPIIGGYLALVAKADKFVASFATAVPSKTSLGQYDVEISSTFVYFFTSIFLLSMFIALVSIMKSAKDVSRYSTIIKKIRRNRDSRIAYNKALRKAYDLIGREAARLHSQLYPSDNGLKYNYKSIHTKYFIDENGDTKVEKKFVIEAGPFPVMKFQFYIDAQPNGSNELLYTDIGFKVDSLDDRLNVAFIPIRDSYQYKDFLILLLPQLEANKTRTIYIEYRWPRMFYALPKDGREDLYWDNRGYNRDKKTDLISEFYFDKKIGEVEARVVGISTPNTEIVYETRQNENYIKLCIPDMPVDATNYQISFSKK